MEEKRLDYLDLLRIIAICAVIMTHTSADFVTNYYNNSIEFIIGNILDSISRIGVPLFLMISGALMLRENKPFNVKKSVSSILFLFLFWSVFYAIVHSIVLPLALKQPVSIPSFFVNCFRGHVHLWYMWAIIGLYLLTPILRNFVSQKNKKTVLYFIALLLLFQFTEPLITLILKEFNIDSLSGLYEYYVNNLGLNVGLGLIAYYLVGWYIAHIGLSKKQECVIYALGLAGIVATILLTQAFPDQYALMYSNSNICVFMYSVSVFILIKHIYNPEKSNRHIVSLSRLSFGVYAIHMLVLFVISKLLLRDISYLPLVYFLTLGISFGIAFIISKIPLVRKLIKA